MRPRFTRRALDFALSHPHLAFLLASRRFSYEEVLQVLIEKDLSLLKSKTDRVLRQNNALNLSEVSLAEGLEAIASAKQNSSYELLSRWQSFLYLIARIVNPKIVVETGILYGYSSAAILAAIEVNGLGRLISIDLPAESHKSVIVERKHLQVGIDSDDLSVGCAVPLRLRLPWSRRLGNALELLPEILKEARPISIFIHDSLHTYDHMMAEFSLGYDALEPGGLLIADDISYNSAWRDFCEIKKEDSQALSKVSEFDEKFGFLVKSSK